MDKKSIIGLIVGLVLLVSVIFVAANYQRESSNIGADEAKGCNGQCGSDSGCKGKCNGNCGVEGCGCAKAAETREACSTEGCGADSGCGGKCGGSCGSSSCGCKA